MSIKNNFQVKNGLSINDRQVIDGSANATFNGAVVAGVDILNYANSAYNQANTGTVLAQAAFDKANTESSQAFTQAAFDTANIASSNIVIIQGVDTSQNARMAIIESTNVTQNTALAATDGKMQSAYGQANTGTVLAQAAFNSANNVSPQIQPAFNVANSASANTIITQGIDVTQNTRLTVIEGTDVSQNARMTIGDGVNASQNVRLDYSNTAITIIQGVDVGQNTAIAATDGKMSSSYNQANTGTVLAQGAFNQSNASFLGVNTAIAIIQGTDVSQNARMAIIEGVDVTQNTAIANKLNLTGSLNQTVSGNVIFSNDVTVTGNLFVLGNTTTFRTSQLDIGDSLIYLANNNYLSDIVDIGIIGHYNPGSSNAHTGIFRDPVRKEWIFFQGYQPEVQSNNIIDTNDASFAYANVWSSYFKGNLIATTAVVNGIDLSTYTQATYAQANVTIGVDTTQNTRLTVIENTDVGQNSRMTIIEGTDVSQNVRLDYSNTAITIIQGVDVSQNARMTIIEGTDVGQNTRLTVIEGTNASQNVRLDYSNAAITIIQGVDVGQNTAIAATDGKMASAYNQANTGTVLAQASYNQSNASFLAVNSAITIIQGTDTSQNARMTIIEGTDVGQNTRMVVIEGTDVSQNANITLLQAYVNAANANITSLYITANNALPNTGTLVTVNSLSRLYVSNTTTSTSNTTGALTVAGGIGIAGPIYSTGGSLTINNGFATTGNSGTIFLGDGSFTKTYGSGWSFPGSGVTATQFSGAIDAPSGSNSAPSIKNQGTNNGLYFPAGQGVVAFSANQANALFISAPTSGVNYLQVSGNTTGGAPVISAQGTDANINMNFLTQGTGNFNFGSPLYTNTLQLRAGNGGTGIYAAGTGAAELGISSALGYNLRFFTNSGSGEVLRMTNTGSAVNFFTMTGSATGGYATLGTSGTDANTNIRIQSGNGGVIDINKAYSSTTASSITIGSIGGATGDASGGAFWRGLHMYAPNFTVGGTVNSFPRSSHYFEFSSMADPTYRNYYHALGNASAGNNYTFIFTNNTGGWFDFKSSTSNSTDNSFRILPANNFAGITHTQYLQVTGAVTSNTPIMSSQGTDANPSMAFIPKGTGAFDVQTANVNFSNGNTITSIYQQNGGSPYTSTPTVTISNPTTAGGTVATANAFMGLWGTSIVNAGSGYTVNDIITFVGGVLNTQAVQVQVLTVNGTGAILTTGVYNNQFGNYWTVPTSPISVTGGTGTAATFNSTWTVYGTTVINAGSGYIEQPTVTYSAAGGSGAVGIPYVGGAANLKTLGTNLNFYTPGGLNFRVADTGQNPTGGYWSALYSGQPTLRAQSGAGVGASIQNSGTGPLYFGTSSGITQLTVTHTASAVNYVNVTGSATGAAVSLNSQGSDANVAMSVSTKGSGILYLGTGSSGTTTRTEISAGGSVVATFAAVAGRTNYMQLTGASSGSSPTFIARSSTDTNVGLLFGAFNDGNLDFMASGDPNAGTGKLQFRITPTANAVNYVQVTGNTTGNAVTISAQGTDANVSMQLLPKGTGSVLINQNYNQSTVNVGSTLQITGNVAANGSILAQNLYIQGGSNYIQYSANLQNNSSWTNHTGDVANTTVTANTTIAAPDGTLTTWQLNNNGNQTTPGYGIYQLVPVISGNGPFTISVWLRSGSLTSGQFYMSGSSDDTVSAGGVVNLTSQWQRFVFTAYNFVSGGARLQLSTNGQSGSILVWGPQLEVGGPFTAKGVASPYVPTYGAYSVVASNNSVYVPTGNVSASNIITPNKVGWVNSNNVSQVYQTYNTSTNSLDIVFG